MDLTLEEIYSHDVTLQKLELDSFSAMETEIQADADWPRRREFRAAQWLMIIPRLRAAVDPAWDTPPTIYANIGFPQYEPVPPAGVTALLCRNSAVTAETRRQPYRRREIGQQYPGLLPDTVRPSEETTSGHSFGPQTWRDIRESVRATSQPPAEGAIQDVRTLSRFPLSEHQIRDKIPPDPVLHRSGRSGRVPKSKSLSAAP